VTTEDAAACLHAGFLLPRIERTYLVPLDQLALEDTTKRPHEELRNVSFGKCEIILLENNKFAQYVPVNALGRFEQRHRFEPEKPFAIPWVYSFTDDPFSEPSRAPDRSSLSWTIVGDEEHEYEVPDQSNYFSFNKVEIETALRERWNRLQATLNRSAAVGANFHPLTKHFFMKAFQEEGVDEIIALISCIEATLMLPDEKGPDRLKKRYKKLVSDDMAYDSLELAYAIRRRYLHALGDHRDTMDWKEFGKSRWAVAKAVDNYLTLAGRRSGEDRETLLRSLKR
jgi:hypothetical protein